MKSFTNTQTGNTITGRKVKPAEIQAGNTYDLEYAPGNYLTVQILNQENEIFSILCNGREKKAHRNEFNFFEKIYKR